MNGKILQQATTYYPSPLILGTDLLHTPRQMILCSSFACPDGYNPIADAEATPCDDTGCTTAQCCQLFCSSFACPDTFNPFDDAGTILCDASGCTTTQCCQLFCSSFACPVNYTLINNAYIIPCDESGCDTDSCCGKNMTVKVAIRW